MPSHVDTIMRDGWIEICTQNNQLASSSVPVYGYS